MANTEASLRPDVSREDRILWTLTPNVCCSTRSAWMALRSTAAMVDWFHMVWFKNHVPGWAFIQWVAILGGLATRDRLMMSWGVTDDAKDCALCHGGLKSHSHLFVNCQFSMLVLAGVRS